MALDKGPHEPESHGCLGDLGTFYAGCSADKHIQNNAVESRNYEKFHINPARKRNLGEDNLWDSKLPSYEVFHASLRPITRPLLQDHTIHES